MATHHEPHTMWAFLPLPARLGILDACRECLGFGGQPFPGLRELHLKREEHVFGGILGTSSIWTGGVGTGGHLEWPALIWEEILSPKGILNRVRLNLCQPKSPHCENLCFCH